jgi:MFS family permease
MGAGVAPPTHTAQVECDAVPGRNMWWLVAGAALLIFLAQFDTFVVAAALPTMQGELGFRTDSAQWVPLGFLLPMIAVSLPAGRWLDRVGARPALCFAVTGFALSSIAAGLASDLGWLIGARVLQGVCAALMIAQAFSLATIAVQPSARGRSMAAVATLGALGAVSGPTAGGYLTEAAGWPWIFFVNVPICLLLVGISWAQAPSDGPLQAPSPDAVWETATLGAAAAVIVLSFFLSAGHGLGWLALAALAVPFLALWARLPGSETVIGLVRRPGMMALHGAMLTVFASFLLVLFLAPFYLQRVQHASVATVGLTLLALPSAQLALGPVGGIVTDRWGARPPAAAGVGTLIGGTAMLLPLDPGWTTPDLAWRLGVMGAGLGLALGPLQTMAMSHSPVELLGTASATINLARQFGIALGPALATVLWASSGYHIAGVRAAFGLAVGLGLTSLATIVLARGQALRLEVDAT